MMKLQTLVVLLQLEAALASRSLRSSSSKKSMMSSKSGNKREDLKNLRIHIKGNNNQSKGISSSKKTMTTMMNSSSKTSRVGSGIIKSRPLPASSKGSSATTGPSSSVSHGSFNMPTSSPTLALGDDPTTTSSPTLTMMLLDDDKTNGNDDDMTFQDDNVDDREDDDDDDLDDGSVLTSGDGNAQMEEEEEEEGDSNVNQDDVLPDYVVVDDDDDDDDDLYGNSNGDDDTLMMMTTSDFPSQMPSDVPSTMPGTSASLLTACRCDSSYTCFDQDLSPGVDLDLCVLTTSGHTTIDDIASLALLQEDLVYGIFSDDLLWVCSERGCRISTPVPSIFFDSLHLTAHGEAIVTTSFPEDDTKITRTVSFDATIGLTPKEDEAAQIDTGFAASPVQENDPSIAAWLIPLLVVLLLAAVGSYMYCRKNKSA